MNPPMLRVKLSLSLSPAAPAGETARYLLIILIGSRFHREAVCFSLSAVTHPTGAGLYKSSKPST